MKSIFALFVVFSLLLVVNLSYARKDPGDYWKNVMNGQPMPEAIKDLIQVPQVSDAGKDHFIRDFDIKPNIILYHTHVESKQQKQKAFDQKFEPASGNHQKGLKMLEIITRK
ncbi:uncharacterized protein LOC133284610 [Gastrolobium bilobum]|uniref:uncharacterized protein LOC133284610 n=1 Tax=Gastrolobium bilobum TaxID=150636 RepID=UPI002AAF7CD2|nr:uncharacterized protein LOC133284610 [Gastrolobium bilobum]